MAMSGVEVCEDVNTLFNEMKLKHTHKWATFVISKDSKKIEIGKRGDVHKTEDKESDKACFEELKAELKDEPRYALYDFEFKNKEERLLQKLYFIVWNPDDGKIKPKMMYASSKDAIKKGFNGIAGEFQINDKADLDYDTMAEEIERKA